MEIRLNSSWINNANPNDNQQFWEHKWNDHDSRMRPTMTQIEYFDIGLSWWDKINLLDILTKSGFVPGKLHDINQMNNRLIRELGRAPIITCSFINGQLCLKDIRVCLTKDGKNIRKCPSQANKNTCQSRKSQIYIPL